MLPAFFSQCSLALLTRFPAFWRTFPFCPDITLAQLQAHLAQDAPTRDDRAMIADHPSADAGLLGQLATDPDLYVRRAVALNPHTPPALLTQLATNESSFVRSAVAHHPATPPTTLAMLAGDDELTVRNAIAHHRSTPRDALTELASDRHMSARVSAALNPCTPRAALTVLLDDDITDVRQALAGNLRLALVALLRLFADPYMQVRRAAAKNLMRRSAATLALLWRRRGFPLSSACLAADTALPLPREVMVTLLDEYQQFIPGTLATWPRASGRLLAALAMNKDANTYGAIVRHPHTPAHVLRMLIEDREIIGWAPTMEELLKNPAVQPAMLETLFLTDAIHLGAGVMRHPSMTDSLRASLYSRYCMGVVQDGIRQPDEMTAYSDASWHDHLLERGYYWLALASSHLDAACYRKSAASLDWRDRCVVAHNEVTPRDAVERLADDGNRFVRAAARVNLARRDGRTCERIAASPYYARYEPDGNPDGDWYDERSIDGYHTITVRLTPSDAAPQGVEPATIEHP